MARLRLPALCGVLLALLLPGCPDTNSRPDGGVSLMDGTATNPLGDDDGDFVCNQRELDLGTDPLAPDSDGDGFSDWAEIVFGWDALRPAEPDRDFIVVLSENPESTLQVQLERTVRASGEDYTGAFEGLPARDIGGATADTYFDSAVAFYAYPADNVTFIDGEAFRGVTGTTLLGFEVRFAFGTSPPRGCIRAYPWRYNVKRSDGRLVGLFRYTLIVLPAGERLTTAEWCAPDMSGCLL